ncbi:hypothetical protein NCCP2222_08840 [Sporosarcina sp. NCCP-2222]|uniref:hypothetical protein n=1 Tax=Sporosarcina sp. NCCP-2222 TaxID=2935073 RepID=UPI00208C03F2|nr:hypothetical protein [Sporosarcina sp. NCCP-2222]GKV54937.1 hypothetical protein NCCP2222_08840 [Sporosarcina sp. NCCP-2222]
MKGKTLVIGLILFVIIVVAVIYFAMMAQFKKDENGWEPIDSELHMITENGIY